MSRGVLELKEADFALKRAVQRDSQKGVESAVAKGADIEFTDSKYNRPLDIACLKDHAVACKTLLTLGASPVSTGRMGRLALHVAAREGALGCVKALLDTSKELQRLQVTARCQFGDLPIHYALDSGDSRRVELAVRLVEAGSPVDGVGREYTPLGMAARRGHVDLIKFFAMKKVDLEAIDKEDSSALHQAVKTQQFAAAQALIQAGVKLDTKGRDGKTALHMACSSGYGDMASLLLEAGADPYMKSKLGEDAFSCADGDEVRGILNSWRARQSLSGVVVPAPGRQRRLS